MRYDFIEIGTANFDTLTERCSEETIGIAIEPLQHLLDQLPNRKNVKKICAAISNTSNQLDIFYVTQEKINQYNLPWWFIGSSAVNDVHDGIRNVLASMTLEEDKIVSKQTVQSYTLSQIMLENNVTELSVLKIDTEGHDALILDNYFDDYTTIKSIPLADTIIFEHNGLYSESDYKKILIKAADIGYASQEELVENTILKLGKRN